MMICVDTGGTKTLVCRMSQTGEILQQLRFPTPRQYAAYSDQLIAAITSLAGGESVTTISLALPGVVKNNVGLWCPNLGWRDVAVAATLQPHWPDARIVVENDANLAGLHEISGLAPAPALGLYITISTGIGIGAVVNGTISPALRHSEAGHMQLLWDGRLQAWEDFASGRAIAEAYGRYASDIHNPATWHEIAQRIARGFVVLIPTLQPDAIVIGGSIGAYFSRYQSALTEHITHHTPAGITQPVLSQAASPHHAVIYGAYRHAQQQPAC